MQMYRFLDWHSNKRELSFKNGSIWWICVADRWTEDIDKKYDDKT